MPETAPERERNRILRRADWRFLLPNPSPRTSGYLSQGALSEAVEAISEHVVDLRKATGPCDLVVASSPGARELRWAWSTLQPGGWCYAEWAVCLPGGLGRTRAQLESAGFEHVTCYVTWPWFGIASPRFWVPLESQAALRFFLDTRPPPFGAGLFKARLRRLGRALWATGLRVGVAAPFVVLARKPGPEPEQQWQDISSQLLLTPGERAENKVVRLVFTEPDSSPRLVIKQARVPDAHAGLRAEAATLQAIHARTDGALDGVPRIEFCVEHESGPIVGETMLEGEPLITRVRPGTVDGLAQAATSWQIRLAATPAPASRSGAWRKRLVDDTLSQFEAQFGGVADSQRVARTRAELCALGPLPLVPEQRDFGPWNILVDASGRLGVLDWESAELEGLPATDLIYFFTYLGFVLDGAYATRRFRDSYRRQHDPSTRIGALRASCLLTYTNAVGLRTADLRPLALLTWLIHAQSEYRRLSEDRAGSPTRADLRNSLFLSLWEEEVRCGPE